MPFDFTIIGGGPGGLYFAIQMMRRDPSHDITILERNPRGSTFGWGVVFSEGTLENFREADEKTFREITDTLAFWDDVTGHAPIHNWPETI